MKLMMALVPSECMQEVQELVERHEIHAYTEIPSVLGAGRAGKKLGTRAFPGTTGMILLVVESEKAEAVVEAIREFADCSCEKGVRMFSIPADLVI